MAHYHPGSYVRKSAYRYSMKELTEMPKAERDAEMARVRKKREEARVIPVGVKRDPKHQQLSSSVCLGEEHPDDHRVKAEKMCPRFVKFGPLHGMSAWPDEGFKNTPTRIQCPTCGRRMMARKVFGHDGDFLVLGLPIHKKKGWWKKPKREVRKTLRRATRRGRDRG